RRARPRGGARVPTCARRVEAGFARAQLSAALAYRITQRRAARRARRRRGARRASARRAGRQSRVPGRAGARASPAQPRTVSRCWRTKAASALRARTSRSYTRDARYGPRPVSPLRRRGASPGAVAQCRLETRRQTARPKERAHAARDELTQPVHRILVVMLLCCTFSATAPNEASIRKTIEAKLGGAKVEG